MRPSLFSFSCIVFHGRVPGKIRHSQYRSTGRGNFPPHPERPPHRRRCQAGTVCHGLLRFRPRPPAAASLLDPPGGWQRPGATPFQGDWPWHGTARPGACRRPAEPGRSARQGVQPDPWPRLPGGGRHGHRPPAVSRQPPAGTGRRSGPHRAPGRPLGERTPAAARRVCPPWLRGPHRHRRRQPRPPRPGTGPAARPPRPGGAGRGVWALRHDGGCGRTLPGERHTCQVSLETHMACGLGACLGCTVHGGPTGTCANMAR